MLYQMLNLLVTSKRMTYTDYHHLVVWRVISSVWLSASVSAVCSSAGFWRMR